MTIESDTGIWTCADAWPWPKLIVTEKKILVFTNKEDACVSCYELININNQWIATEIGVVGTIDNIQAVSVALFNDYYILCIHRRIHDVDDSIIYYRPTTSDALSIMPEALMPRGTTCCSFLGQLLIGGLHTTTEPWKDLPIASVSWSAVGSIEMLPESNVGAGYAVLPWGENNNGSVWAMNQLGNNVNVYGDSGWCALTPYAKGKITGFGVSDIIQPGLLGVNSFAGSARVHGFVNSNYDWCLVTKDGVKNLGYRNYMKTMSDDLVVSYDKHRQRFYISDGSLCFVYTKHGMYSTHQCVSSIGDYKGLLVGFFKSNEDTKIRLETTPLDFGHQSHKTIEAIEAGLTYDTVADEVVSGKLSVKYDYKGDFVTLPLTQLNPRGIFTQKATGREFKIHLEGDYEADADFSLSSLDAKIKLSDKINI